MSDLDIWNNPMLPLDQRLELAIIEINKLRVLLSSYRSEAPIDCQHPRAYLRRDEMGTESCSKCGRYWN